MAVAAEELAAGGSLTAEEGTEYSRLTSAGSAPGRATLLQARRNVAQRAAAAKPAPAAARPRQQRQRSSAAALPPVVTAPARAARASAGAVGRAAGAVSTPSRAAQALTRIVWAVALGLIALQVVAEVTGQQWQLAIPGTGQKPVKQPYQPLYAGGEVGAAMPGLTGQVVAQSPQTNLSGRLGGNLAV